MSHDALTLTYRSDTRRTKKSTSRLLDTRKLASENKSVQKIDKDLLSDTLLALESLGYSDKSIRPYRDFPKYSLRILNSLAYYSSLLSEVNDGNYQV